MEKSVKIPKMILTSQWREKHLFAGQNTQQTSPVLSPSLSSPFWYSDGMLFELWQLFLREIERERERLSNSKPSPWHVESNL